MKILVKGRDFTLMDKSCSSDKTHLTTASTHIKATPVRLFWSFFVIGAFTFGGGYAMLPLIQKSLVDKSQWLGDEEFVDAIAVAQCSPGPIAANIAIMTGYKLNGISGALASVLGATLPSFLILLAIATFFLGVENNRFVRAALTGMRPAIVGLMVSAIFDVGKKTIKSRQAALLTVGAFILLTGFGTHPVLIILASACFGLALNRGTNSGSKSVSQNENNRGGNI